jgi:D-threo-aldose 1-dehydrogenase
MGIRCFDTAPRYGNGLSEIRLGKALSAQSRSRYRLCTKVGWDIYSDQDKQPAFSRDGVLRSLESSMQRLQTDYIDLVHIHDPDDHFDIARDETYPTLLRLKQEGVIGAIGVGMNQWEMLGDFLRVETFDYFLLAGRYTLLEQTSRTFLDQCAASHTKVYAGGLFNSGILATGAVQDARYNYAIAPQPIIDRVQLIEKLCAEHHVPLNALALQFAWTHPAIDMLIVGARTPEEIQSNIQALKIPIPGTLWTQLEALGIITMGDRE